MCTCDDVLLIKCYLIVDDNVLNNKKPPICQLINMFPPLFKLTCTNSTFKVVL